MAQSQGYHAAAGIQGIYTHVSNDLTCEHRLLAVRETRFHVVAQIGKQNIKLLSSTKYSQNVAL